MLELEDSDVLEDEAGESELDGWLEDDDALKDDGSFELGWALGSGGGVTAVW